MTPPARRWATVATGFLVGVLGVLGTVAAPSAGGAAVTDDPVYTQGLQWGLDTIGAPAAWQTTRGAGTTIAVIDSGIDLQHEDLAGKVVASTRCIGAAGDPAKCRGSAQDDNGHGTHVAGIAAAATGNGKGIAGVAPDAQLLVVRVLANQCEDGTTRSCTAAGTAGDVAAGIRWAADRGATVINLSLGGSDALTQALVGCPFCDAIEYAWSKGAIPVIAAGNDSVLPPGFGDEPAVVVTATTRQDTRASYSNAAASIFRTARWPVAAPGGEGETSASDCATGGSPKGILSTYWIRSDPGGPQHRNEYACLAGTSMAAPHVAGALALLRSQGLAPQAAVERLLGTARDLGDPGRDPAFGAGRIDLATAVGPPGATTLPAPSSSAATSTTLATTTVAPSTTLGPDPTDAEPGLVTPTTTPPEAFAAGPASATSEPDEALVALAVALVVATGTGTASVAWRRTRPPLT